MAEKNETEEHMREHWPISVDIKWKKNCEHSFWISQVGKLN